MIGRRVSQYRIIEKLGEGGMGEVYLAEDTSLHRRVALKFLGGELVGEPGFTDRFMREARAAAALNHPNIVTIHEVGEHEGRPFIAMAYVEGDTLSDVIARGPLDVDVACDVAAQICSGLHLAHEMGIVHRDIKPDNVIIDAAGRAHILDFGLAKLRGVSRESGDHSTLGTIYYMSPEQASGTDVDNRSDLFSVASVLYEMLTGVPPFKKEHSAAVMYSIVNEDPKPVSSLRKVPAAIEQILAKALRKDPSERYQSADEFRTDLLSPGAVAVTGRSGPAKRVLKYALPTSVVFAAVMLFFVIRPFRFEFSGQENAVAARNSLAVMYFDNVVHAEDPERLGEIVTNLLITDLSESEYLDVVSSQRLYDVLKFEGYEGAKVVDRSTATSVATRVGAKWMLLGSILQVSPAYIVTSQLIDVESGTVAASQRIDGKPGEDIFVIVDRLTAAVGEDLAVPTGGETDVPLASLATTHSETAYRYYLEGVESANKYFFGEARASFLKALDYDSTMAMAYYHLSTSQVAGDHEEKLGWIATAMEYREEVSEKERMYIESRSAELLGNTDEAIAVLEELISKYPDEKDAYVRLGDIYRRDDKRAPEKSIAYYRRAIEIDPMDKRSYNILAYQYQELGDIDNYIWAIHQYMTIAPDEPNPYDSRGDLYAYSGRPDKAVTSYQQAVDRKADFWPSVGKLGIMLMFQGDYAGARAQFQKMVEADEVETRAMGRTHLARLLAFQGRYRDAISEVDEAIATDRAEGYERGPLLDKYALKAHVHVELGQFERALATVDDFIETLRTIAPSDSLGGGALKAYFLTRAGRTGEAKKLLEELRSRIGDKGPSHLRGYHAATGWLAITNGDPATGIDMLEKAAEGTQSFQLRYFLARAYLAGDRVIDSANEFQTILRRYSESRAESPVAAVTAYYYAGLAYERSGKMEKARDRYVTFVNLWRNADAGNDLLRDAKTRLDRLESS